MKTRNLAITLSLWAGLLSGALNAQIFNQGIIATQPSNSGGLNPANVTMETEIPLYRYRGVTVGSNYGEQVVNIGDVNGDGFEDLAVGAPSASSRGLSGNGQVFIESGRNGETLRVLYGQYNREAYGSKIAALGDLNNDGAVEFAVASVSCTAVPQQPEVGCVSVLSARNWGYYYSVAMAQPLMGLAGAGFGFDIAGLGDTDGDGMGDFIVAAPALALGAGQGRVYLYSGNSTQPQLRTLTPPNSQVYAFGFAVTGVGDINNDGRNDFAIGCPVENTPRVTAAGQTLVISGTGPLLSTLMGDTYGIVRPGEGFGTTLAGAGLGLAGGTPKRYRIVGHDLNNDGVGDLVVGIPSKKDAFGNIVVGRVVAISGQNFSTLFATEGSPAMNPPVGFNKDIGLGYSLAVGDINNDGQADVVASAPGVIQASPPILGMVKAFSYDPSSVNGAPIELFRRMGDNSALNFFLLGSSVALVRLKGETWGNLVIGTTQGNSLGTVEITRIHGPIAPMGSGCEEVQGWNQYSLVLNDGNLPPTPLSEVRGNQPLFFRVQGPPNTRGEIYVSLTPDRPYLYPNHSPCSAYLHDGFHHLQQLTFQTDSQGNYQSPLGWISNVQAPSGQRLHGSIQAFFYHYQGRLSASNAVYFEIR